MVSPMSFVVVFLGHKNNSSPAEDFSSQSTSPQQELGRTPSTTKEKNKTVGDHLPLRIYSLLTTNTYFCDIR